MARTCPGSGKVNWEAVEALNDMMCHSVEVARLPLTDPAKPRDSVRPVKVSATIASLKWSRPEYADLLRADDGRRG